MAKNDDTRSRLLLSLMIYHFETEWEIKIESSSWHQNKKWSADTPSEGCIRIVCNHWPPAPHSFLLIKNSVNLTHFSDIRKNSKAWQRLKKKTDLRDWANQKPMWLLTRHLPFFNRQFTSFAFFGFPYWTFCIKTIWPVLCKTTLNCISLYLLQ